MESQQQTSLVLLANNVSTLSSSENKITPSVSEFSTNINYHRYNYQLVWSRFGFCTAGVMTSKH